MLHIQSSADQVSLCPAPAFDPFIFVDKDNPEHKHFSPPADRNGGCRAKSTPAFRQSGCRAETEIRKSGLGLEMHQSQGDIRACWSSCRSRYADLDCQYIQQALVLGIMDSPDVEHGADSILKRLTLTFRSVNVHVTAPDAALGETLLSYADPRQLFGFLYNSSKPKRVSCLTPTPTHTHTHTLTHTTLTWDRQS